jgi:PAS domain S-box-containing protein
VTLVEGDDLLAQVPAAVIAVDLEHRITLWSPGAEALYGWSAEEALGRSVRELILVDQVPLAEQVAAATHDGGVWEGEVVVRHRDGSDLLVHVRNAPLRDEEGTLVGVIGASLDVADARRVETVRADELRRASAEAAAAADRLGRLQRLTAALVPAQEEGEVASTICTEVVSAVGAAAAGVVLVAPGGSHLDLAGAVGYSEEQLSAYRRVDLAEGTPVATAYLRGEPLLFPDRESFAEAFPGLRTTGSFHARACLPISVDSTVIGVLAMSFDEPHDFAVEEQMLLLTIARMCGQALERARLITRQERTRQREQVVAAASELLSSSLDISETLQTLTALLVPGLADYVVVHLVDASGAPRVAAVTHRDPEVTTWAKAQAEAVPLDMDAPDGMGRVLRTGEPALHPATPPELRRRVEEIAGPELAAALVPVSGIGVPIAATGRVLGGLAVVRVEGEPYTDEDLQLVQEIADRAAVAVSHAQAYERERSTALTLQQSLLPRELPAVPGLRYGWRYLPGTAGVHVGGDWYDVVELDHHRVALLIGDVMGRGLEAAGIMGQLRAAARAHMTADRSPAAVLRALDDTVTRLEQGTITTALVAVLDPATRTLVYASAGHLPPLVARTEGTSFLPLDPGPPLGTQVGGWTEHVARLEPGDSLLLFTDGLVEDRTRPVSEGLELLRRSVVVPAGPHEACEQALRGTGRDLGHDDDTAVLGVTLADEVEAADHFLSVTVTGPTAARKARSAARSALAGWDVPGDVVDDLLVVLTELVVNAVLHAGGTADVTLRREPSAVRVEVRDEERERMPLPSLTALVSAPGRPDDDRLDAVIAELDRQGTTGRGTTLVAGLAESWGVDLETTGKCVWARFPMRPGPAPVPAARGGSRAAIATLRGLPVRLVLASASNLDDLEREIRTSPLAPEVLGRRFIEDGARLMLATASLREPSRHAAREALARGQRAVDVSTPVTTESVEALFALRALIADVEDLARGGVLMTPTAELEVAAFRTWWAEELRRQLDGEAPRDCPFPPLPA